MSEWQRLFRFSSWALETAQAGRKEWEISEELGNPYAPPENQANLGIASHDDRDLSEAPRLRSWGQSLVVWSLVCIVSAAPSFFWGLSTIASSHVMAMLTGVGIFIGLYTLGDQWTQESLWRRNQALRLSLKIGYITRLAMSVIFPVGGFLDMFCGVFSITLVEFVTRSNIAWNSGPDTSEVVGVGFFFTLLTTLVQGFVLNVVLAFYVLLVWGIAVLFQQRR